MQVNPTIPASLGNSRSLLLRLMLLQMLQQQAQAQQGQGQAQKPSSMQQLIDYARKAKGAYDDGKSAYTAIGNLYNSINGTSAFTPATQAAWNQAAGEAGQAAWNAGANAASNAPTTGTTPQASGTNYAGWAAAALSAYNDAQKLMGDNLTDEEKALEGSRAIPRAAAAYFTGGLSLLGEGFARKQWGGTAKKLDNFAMKYDPFVRISKLWTSDEWKKEGNRLRALQEKGINIPDALQGPMMLKRGRKKSELINPYLPKDFIGKDLKYGWTNNKFAESRDEKDLRPEDIWGYSAFFEKYGNDWLGKFSEGQRRNIAQTLLDKGAVSEGKGSIDIKWSPELENQINQMVSPQPPPAKRAPAPISPTTKIPQIKR